MYHEITQTQQRRADRQRVGTGVLVAIAPLWSLFSYQPTMAAPAAQEAGMPLGLGEYGTALTIAGDTLVYTVEIPESGAYIVSPANEAASSFGLTITDATGEVLFNDIFTTVELALEPGPLTLEFNASVAEALFFVVAGEIGTMSSDPDAPGRLFVGSAYAEEGVTGPRYAQIVVPPTASPQRVVVYIEGGEEDVFFAFVDGEGIDFAWLETDESNLLSFWSTGGTYQLNIEPYERRSSFSVAIFQTPPPTPLVADEVIDALIPAGVQDIVFEVTLDRPYNLLSIDILDGAEGLSIDFVDQLYDQSFFRGSFGDEFLDIENVPPGTYYVRIFGDIQEEERLITLSLSGEAGQPIETLTLDEATTGMMEEGFEVVYYQVEIPEAGRIVAAALATEADDVIFNLSMGLRVGEPIWYSFFSGSEDVITFVAPVAGTYYVGIESNGLVGEYGVAVSMGDLASEVSGDGSPLLNTISGFERGYHRMVVDEAGQIVTVLLAGSENGDLDLRISGYNELGRSTVMEYGFSSGSVEAISFVAPEAGTLEISVISYSDETVNYAVVGYLEDPRRIVGLWAIDAAASSEYDVDEYSALQATGAPDTPGPGSSPAAWAALEADAGEEILELAYAFPLIPAEINIYESDNPGAIFAVQIYDLAADEWLTVWEGEPGPLDQPSRVFSIDLPPSDILTDGVRIFLDTTAVSGWNEIDAVQLRGRP